MAGIELLPKSVVDEAAAATSRCALITGGNKGIGYGIARRLSRIFKGTVYLTARNEARGREAVQALARDDRVTEFLLLDVTDRASIERARDHIMEKHGGLDVLVNNAGVAGFDFHKANGLQNHTLERMLDSAEPEAKKDVFSPEVVKEVIGTNFFGLLNVCEVFFPILRPHARVVNFGSNLGTLRSLKLEDVKKRLVSDDLTVEELKQIVLTYAKIAETKNPAELGYPAIMGPYAFSKICVVALTRVQQRVFDRDTARPDIVVNAVSPGFVATEMTAYKGVRTIEEGAEGCVQLAVLPAATGQNALDIPKGQFLRDGMPIDWVGERDKF
ncbi:putative Carbonyl reductase [NADPH] 3 [Hypsibius exemplaris]|uniref:Carbonyl reductase [NADPH] 3 n=1 Tax=Hypsibius exemplaris TaxID=2072580 RepID=A0A1W0WL42_HYPEX|nr:putative Carbonyl reductase [NADPH] 3 [Hypsibius exemplaris]